MSEKKQVRAYERPRKGDRVKEHSRSTAKKNTQETNTSTSKKSSDEYTGIPGEAQQADPSGQASALNSAGSQADSLQKKLPWYDSTIKKSNARVKKIQAPITKVGTKGLKAKNQVEETKSSYAGGEA